MFDQIERVVVNGDDDQRVYQLDGPQAVVWPHGEVVADGQNGDIHTFLADQLHVIEQPGVAGVIDGLAVYREKKPCRVAAIGAIGQRRAVMGDGQLDPTEREVPPASDVHGVDFAPLCLAVVADLEIGYDGRSRPLRYRYGISEMIPVTV